MTRLLEMPLNPGYSGVEVPRDLHQLLGRGRWLHHAPRGQRQVEPCQPRHREDVWMDQAMERAAPVQCARQLESQWGVLRACTRLKSDQAGQSAQDEACSE